MEYGRKLAELRSNRGLSQEELAHAIGVAPSEISSRESCAAYPDQLHLAAAASALKVQVTSIIEDDVEEMLTAIRVAETRETVYVAGPAMLALTCTAGMNPKLATAQFVLGAVLAASLIALPAIIEPGSRLPWVML